jgi:hypothetical protein
MARNTSTQPWAVTQKLKGQSPHMKFRVRAKKLTPNDAAAQTTNKAAVSHRNRR